jgi:hypothetical protein
MNEIININQLELFQLYREAIQNEISERDEKVQNFIDSLTPDDEIIYTEDDIDPDNLPF